VDASTAPFLSLSDEPTLNFQLIATSTLTSLRIELEMLYGPGRQVVVKNASGVTVLDTWDAIRSW